MADMIDLEELFTDYVWRKYKEKQVAKGLFLRKSDCHFLIRWDNVDFVHETEKPDACVDDQQNVSPPSEDKPLESHFSEYENRTQLTQTYRFTTTRQSTETIKFQMQNTYSLGGKVNLSVDLKCIKLGTELTESITVGKMNGQENANACTWNIDTEIKVPEMHRAKATLYIYEASQSSSFKVKTTISLPNGYLIVGIKRKKNNEEIPVEYITDLADVFAGVGQSLFVSGRGGVHDKLVKRNGIYTKESYVVVISHGYLECAVFKKHCVKVSCERIYEERIYETEV